MALPDAIERPLALSTTAEATSNSPPNPRFLEAGKEEGQGADLAGLNPYPPTCCRYLSASARSPSSLQQAGTGSLMKRDVKTGTGCCSPTRQGGAGACSSPQTPAFPLSPAQALFVLTVNGNCGYWPLKDFDPLLCVCVCVNKKPNQTTMRVYMTEQHSHKNSPRQQNRC